MFRNIFYLCILSLSLNALEYIAYDIGGNEEGSRTSISIKGEEFTLLPYSYLELEKDEINRDGEFTLLFGKVNGKDIEPIKVASNYKSQSLVIKVFKSTDRFDESTFITQSEEVYIDSDVMYYSIELERD